MPNLTSLQKITTFIQENKLEPMKQWSKRALYIKDGQLMRYSRDMIKQIKQILILIFDKKSLKKKNRSNFTRL